MNLRIITIVGARPQFIKAAAVSRAMCNEPDCRFDEILVHTGQHYDTNMSRNFFGELDIPEPQYNLGIGGVDHGAMTGRMLEGIEKVLLEEQPDWVLVYGDTNSTLAGALAATKLNIPVAHIEAGMRSFNRRMPEEINRVLTDHVASLLLCSTKTAVANLAAEGITENVYNCGDVMYDASLFYRDKAWQKSDVLQRLGLKEKEFGLVTCHRAENTDDIGRLLAIVEALSELSRTQAIVLPLHPRTKKILMEEELMPLLSKVIMTEPLPYLDMIRLEQSARVIVTDSGGVQKEAFFYRIPCITIRDETEWVETVQMGFNRLVAASAPAIVKAYNETIPLNMAVTASPYGDGQASIRICELLKAASPQVLDMPVTAQRNSA